MSISGSDVKALSRRLTVEEMMQLMDLSGKPFEYFTDPFLWDGDGTFSYRTTPSVSGDLATFEQKAGNWIMLWRWLCSVNDLESVPVPDFGLNVRSSYEDVCSLAGKLVRWMQLGDVPAQSLGHVLE